MTALLVFYVIYAISAFKDYQYLINPDGISYFDIARLWHAGKFWDAINPYWGPFLSWTMVPFLSLGVKPLLAAKIVNLAVGSGVLVGFYFLLRRYAAQWVTMVMTVTLVPLVFSWTLGGYVTPDLWLTFFLLWYVFVVTSTKFGRTWWAAPLAGALAGLAYLAKSYALPFFLVHFTVYTGWKAWRQVAWRWTWEKQFLLGMAGFFVVAVPWIAAISLKHHKLTYGTSGSYTLALVSLGPGRHPVLTGGLIAPPPGGTSAWMDPQVPNVPSVLPQLFPRPHNFNMARDQISTNFGVLFQLLTAFWPLALGALAAALALAYRRGGDLSADGHAMVRFAAFTMLIFVAGYLLIFLEDRYLWFVELLVLLLGGMVISLCWKDKKFARLVAPALVVLTFYTLTLQTGDVMKQRKGANGDIPVVARQISNLPGWKCSSLASNGYWEITTYLAYYLGCPYYGMFGPYDVTKSQDQLTKYRVQYVFLWKTGDKKRDAVPEHFKEVGTIPQEHIKILKFEPES